jgi:hypothetical protein
MATEGVVITGIHRALLILAFYVCVCPMLQTVATHAQAI